jgi:hypothetical protein
MKFTIPTLCVLCLLLLSCKAKEPKVASYQAVLNLRYMETEQKVHAEARFMPLPNNTKQDFSQPEKVELNQTKMREITAVGNVFHYDGPAIPINDGYNLTWSSKNQTPNQETFKLPKCDSLKFDQKVLSHKKPAKLDWRGDPLSGGESIVLLWENKINHEAVTTQATGAQVVSLLNLPAFEIAKVPPGSYKLTVIRKLLLEHQNPDYIAKIQSELYCKPIDVVVVAQ